MHHYTAFGFSIASTIPFPELLAIPETKNPEVTISLGTVPKCLQEGNEVEPGLWITPSQYLIHIEECGYFYAENGNHIIAEPLRDADEKTVRIYLLCNALPAIVHQRGAIPLHASGVVMNGGVALIIGDSGAGKSTTVKALTQRGHPIFTDDVCVLRSHNSVLEGIPSYPLMKLWEASFDLMGLGASTEEHRLWPNVDKYGVSFHDDFIYSWKKIRKLFILEKSDEAKEVSIRKLGGIEAFTVLGSNTYRGWYIEPMKLNGLHFGVIGQLVSQCEVYKIIRPSFDNSLTEVVSTIEQTF